MSVRVAALWVVAVLSTSAWGQEEAAGWRVGSFVDGTGERVTVAALESTHGFNQVGRHIVVTFSCRAGKLAVDVHWDDPIDGLEAQVVYNIGPTPQVSRELWPVTRWRRGTRCPGPRDFVYRLLRGSRLTMRVQLNATTENMAIFDLVGTQDAFMPVLEACDFEFR